MSSDARSRRRSHGQRLRVSPLPPQLVRPRPVQFETPSSYLGRICAANVIDVNYIERLAARRRSATRRANELGHLIEELGGPAPEHFEQEFRRAGQWAGTPYRQAHAFSPKLPGRPACSHCAAGDRAITFDHRDFMVCRRHSRWLDPHHADDQQDVGAAALKADRRLRQLAAAGLVPVNVYDRVGDLLRAHLMGIAKQPPGPTASRHSLLQFPCHVRLVELLANYLRIRCPQDMPLRDWHRRPEEARFRGHMRPQLVGLNLGQQGERDINPLLEGLLDVAMTALSDRTDYAVGF